MDHGSMTDDADAVARQRWLGLENRHLAALSAVAHEGSFSAAADALGYVQSAISQQIAQLERLVGTRVLERDRGGGPVTLTPAGRILLEHTSDLLALYDRARDEFEEVAGGSGGVDAVRVGIVPSVAAGVLPRLLGALKAAQAGVRTVTVSARDGAELAELLARGEVDVAIGDLPTLTDADDVVVEPVLEDRFVALVSVDSPLARRAEPPQPRELGALRLVGTVPSPMQDAVTAWLVAEGAEPNYVVRCNADTAIQSLVAAGLGIAVCPALAVTPDHPGTITRELDPAPPPRTIAIAHRSEPTPAVATILQHARAALVAERRPDAETDEG
jgi:molybdate transport repressor ModE-like protein